MNEAYFRYEAGLQAFAFPSRGDPLAFHAAVVAYRNAEDGGEAVAHIPQPPRSGVRGYASSLTPRGSLPPPPLDSEI